MRSSMSCERVLAPPRDDTPPLDAATGPVAAAKTTPAAAPSYATDLERSEHLQSQWVRIAKFVLLFAEHQRRIRLANLLPRIRLVESLANLLRPSAPPSGITRPWVAQGVRLERSERCLVCGRCAAGRFKCSWCLGWACSAACYMVHQELCPERPRPT